MERSRRLLLVAGLLAALLPAAAAAFGPQPGAPCEPTLLAPQVALFCAPDFPTAQCCELGVPVVDLSASVPCVCRVPAEPQLVMAGLNATHIALYSSGLRPGGAHLAAACEAHPPPAAVVSSPLPTHPSPQGRAASSAAILRCFISRHHMRCGSSGRAPRLRLQSRGTHSPAGRRLQQLPTSTQASRAEV
ncbi:uncharacterized protein LOC119289252 [Triticum dicoccoides]|uniref:uncharacterized protein LOC119289252 n=1 Tax=Triticum dicoccoides TaxID=85692 RepID=UPI00188E8F0F|nr:uncharacterized protein LOC119289252 [Triticum dicoccoides]